MTEIGTQNTPREPGRKLCFWHLDLPRDGILWREDIERPEDARHRQPQRGVREEAAGADPYPQQF